VRTRRHLSVALISAIGLTIAWPGVSLSQELSGDPGTAIGIELGEVPNAVVIEDLEGDDVDLAEYIGGGPTLFEFWAVWCENCEALHPQMQAAHELYGDEVRFVAVGVAVGQSKRAIRRHLKKHPVSYPTLWDANGGAVRAFKAPVTSYIVILDADGRVAYTGAGADQDIEAAIQSALKSSAADSPPTDS